MLLNHHLYNCVTIIIIIMLLLSPPVSSANKYCFGFNLTILSVTDDQTINDEPGRHSTAQSVT